MYMCVQEGTLEMWVPVVARAAASLFFSRRRDSTCACGLPFVYFAIGPRPRCCKPATTAATGGGGDPVENNKLKAGSRLAVRAWGGVGSPLFSWMPHWIGRRGGSREECSSVLV